MCMGASRPRSLTGLTAADCFGKFVGGDFLAAGEFGVGLSKPPQRFGVAHDGQAFFKLVKVIDGYQDRRRSPVHSDSHTLVVIMHAAYELGEVTLHFTQGQRRHGHKSDQNFACRQTAERHTSRPVPKAPDGSGADTIQRKIARL